MTPTHLKIYNYVNLKDVDLDLGAGTYFVTGENRDEQAQESNGAGKSLFCSSFVWCLYEDILSNNVLRDDVIGPFDDYVEIEATFDVDGDEITVNRTRNHPERGNDVKLFVNGNDASHATSKRKTTDMIAERVGVSKDVIYYCAYNDPNREPIVALTPSNLKSVVSDIIGIDKYADAIKKARDKRRTFENKVDTLNHKLDKHESEKENVSDHKASIASQIESWDDKQQERLEELQEDIEERQSELEDLQDEMQSEDELKSKLNDCRDANERVNELNQRMSELESEVKEFREKKQRAETKKTKAEGKKEKWLDKYETVKNPDGKCDVCGNKLSESPDLAKRMKHFKEKADEQQTDVAEYDSLVKKYKNSMKELKKTYDRKKEKRSEFEEEARKYRETKKQLESLDKKKKRIKRKKSKIEDLRSKKEDVADDSPTELKQKRAELNKKLTKIDNKIEDTTEDLSDAEFKVDAYSTLEDACEQIRAARYNKFMMELQTRINDHFESLTGGDFQCKLYKDGGELYIRFRNVSKDEDQFLPYGPFSTGEQARISKAVSAALNEMMDVGFLVDDEGVNGVDDPGIDRILNFMIEENRDKTLFFVAHQKQVRDTLLASGATNVHIIKENGESRVELRNE